MADHPTPFYCSEHSLAIGEQLFGTAPRIQTVLALEYDGRWESDILSENQLPEPVQSLLATWKETLPDTRVFFIKRDKNVSERNSFAFFVALIHETNAALYEFSLADYGDLLTLDIPAVVLSQAPQYDGYRRADPVLLVCTHGRRDRCCARFGRPAYDQLVTLLGDSVWQSSHVGGHRMAANVVTLPHGVFYGRVAQDNNQAFVDAVRSGQIYLNAYRGRTCYSQAEQAAEYYLRRATGLTTLDEVRLVQTNQKEGAWWIRFKQHSTGTFHDIRLAAAKSEFSSFMSCGDAESKNVLQYQLAEHTVVSHAS